LRQEEILSFLASSPLGGISRAICRENPTMILAYHGVCPGNPLCVEPGTFREQIKFLIRNFRVVSMEELLSLRTARQGQGLAAISFDDAYHNIYEYALPVLSEFKLPAIIYVPTDYIGTRNEWDLGRHEPLMKIMDKQRLSEISRMGFAVGSHSASHRQLSTLSTKELMNEITSSRKVLEDLLSRPVIDFAYPYGQRADYDKRVMDLLGQASYRSGVTTCFGRFNAFIDDFALRRVSIWPSDGTKHFIQKLTGSFDWLAGKEAVVHFAKFKWIASIGL